MAKVKLNKTPSDVGRKDFKELINDEGVIVVPRSALNYWFEILLFLVSLPLMAMLSRNYPFSIQRLDLGTIFGIQLSLGIPLFGLVPLVLLGRISHRLLDTKCILCDHYVLKVSGLMSLGFKTTRVPYQHIKTLELDKTFAQRILGLGNVTIATDATQGDAAICLEGAPDPHRFKDIIEQRIDQAKREILTATPEAESA